MTIFRLSSSETLRYKYYYQTVSGEGRRAIESTRRYGDHASLLNHQMKKLFGTDGIRSRAGEFPLDENTLYHIGSALVERFADLGKNSPKFISGRDTRESGPWMESAMHAGIESAGGAAVSAGVMTTPGVAFLAADGAHDAGIVISASHNPFYDNGVKIFLPTGKKLDQRSERVIESRINGASGLYPGGFSVDTAGQSMFRSRYLDHFAVDFEGLDLRGIRIVIDCANGAASELGPALFNRFGADAIPIHNVPDGRNINLNCGSLNLDDLRECVISESADLGIAFDGDADRALFVDARGKVVDGDATLWVMANDLKRQGSLTNDLVVATVMSNVGLENALNAKGIDLLRTDVGDKYVLDALMETGAAIGGEQSGHIIFPGRTLVGDGLQTALFLLRVIRERQQPLDDLAGGFDTLPQILVNVGVEEKVPFERMPAVHRLSKEVEDRLGKNGRLLLRYSGTENLARVMIEGEDAGIIADLAERLAGEIGRSAG